MGTVEVTASIFSVSFPPRTLLPSKPSPSIKLTISCYFPTLSLNYPFSPTPLLSNVSSKNISFQLYSTVQELTAEEKPEQAQLGDQQRKLYVANLPWKFSVADIKSLFGECGTVTDVEIIKQQDGRNRGFAFITMASGEEARAVIDKFDSYELSGRIIRVELSKRLKKPSPPPADASAGETRHKLYVSNLAWKARSSHLRELFSSSFNLISARVVFDNPSGRSAGYGFVSFATREEAEAAISTLDGKELLDRPLRLQFSQKNVDESGSKSEEADNTEEQTNES